METGDRPQLHALPFLLAIQLTHAGLLALHLRRPIRLLFSALLLSLVAFVFGCTTGSVQRDYYIGSLLMTQVFSVILFNWMSDPFHDFHHERDHCAPTSLPFLRRVSWALCVLNSPRGVGWSYTVHTLALFNIVSMLADCHVLGRQDSGASSRDTLVLRPHEAPQCMSLVSPSRFFQSLPTDEPNVFESRHGSLVPRLHHAPRQYSCALQRDCQQHCAIIFAARCRGRCSWALLSS